MTVSTAVVLGAGGIGAACADVLAHQGLALVVADNDSQRVEALADRLRRRGVSVTARCVDISRRHALTELVSEIKASGPVDRLVHAAGVSPTQASRETILSVDLVGTALVLELFGPAMAPGSAAVAIASVAGTLFASKLTRDDEKALAHLPPEELGVLDVFSRSPDRATTYGLAKRGNQLRVRAQALGWARDHQARLNSVSPGLVATPMGRDELAGDDGDAIRALMSTSALDRSAQPSEIADAVAFLLADQSRYITGTDLAVDGGLLASMT